MAAATSATPMKSWNHCGRFASICTLISGGGARKSQPWAAKTSASSTCTIQSTTFMTFPSSITTSIEEPSI